MSKFLPTDKVKFEMEADADHYARADAETTSGTLSVQVSRDEPDTSSDSRRAKCSISFILTSEIGVKLERDRKVEFYGDLRDNLQEHVEGMFPSQQEVVDFEKKLKRSAKAAATVAGSKAKPKP